MSTSVMPLRRALRLLLAVLAALMLAQGAAAAPPVFEDSMAQRMLACSACHGKDGRATPDGYFPRIAGKPAGYLYNQLLNFREGRREYSLMTGMVESLSDAYLLEIAQYFSALDLPHTQVQAAPLAGALRARGQTLAREGDPARRIPACQQCHGTALTGVAPAIPGLLGLSHDYINAQLGAWKAGQRRAHAPDCMAQIVKQLSDEDVNAVASWLATQPLPADSRPARALPPAGARHVTMDCGSAPEAARAGARP